MASKEESGPPPFPPEALAPASATAGSQRSAPPADPPLSLAQPGSAGDPGCRLLLEKNGFQALTQELCSKGPAPPRTPCPREKAICSACPFPRSCGNSSTAASLHPLGGKTMARV